MSNGYVVNSAGLNGSSGSSIINAVLTSIAITISGSSSANLQISGTPSSGIVPTIVTASANQVHRASIDNASLGLDGVGVVFVRQRTAYATGSTGISGTLSTTTIVNSSSTNSVNLIGEIAPNYLLVGVSVDDGVTGLVSSEELETQRVKFSTTNSGVLGLSGHLVSPRTITIDDLFIQTKLDGYCIPANELGYGHVDISTTVSCDAVRIVQGKAHVTLWGEGPVLVINSAAYYKGSGEVGLTGLTNIAIKENNYNHLIWYYEDWLTLNIGTMNVEPLVFRNASTESNNLSVVFDVNPVRRATARPTELLVQVIGSFDTEKRAGLITNHNFVSMTGSAADFAVQRTVTPTGAITTTGNAVSGLLFKESRGSALLSTSGTGTAEVITTRGINSGVVGVTGSATGDRHSLTQIAGSVITTGSFNVVVYKKSYSNGLVNISGNISYDVMTGVSNTNLRLSGFCLGYIAKVGSSSITSSLSGVPVDGRAALIGYVQGITSSLSGVVEGRSLEILQPSIGYSRLDGYINERVVEALYTTSIFPGLTGTPVDSDVLRFVPADETRQMSVSSSSTGSKTSLNVIEVIV